MLELRPATLHFDWADPKHFEAYTSISADVSIVAYGFRRRSGEQWFGLPAVVGGNKFVLSVQDPELLFATRSSQVMISAVDANAWRHFEFGIIEFVETHIAKAALRLEADPHSGEAIRS